MLPCGTFNQKYGEDVAIVRTRLQWGLMVVFFVLLFCLPFFPGVRSGLLSWVIMASITLIAVLGLHI